MSFIAVAIGGASIVGAGAAIIGGNKASKVAQQTAAANNVLQREQNAEAARQYDTSRSDLAPYRDAGYKSLSQLTAGNEPGAEFNRKYTRADVELDPGYQFRLGEGQRGVEASAAARGGALSGRTLKELDQYNQGFASNEFGNAYNRYQADLTSRFNRLSGVAGTGQTAVNAGNAAGQALIDSKQTGVNNINNNNNQAANARISQYGNVANAIGGVANTLGGLAAGGFGGKKLGYGGVDISF